MGCSGGLSARNKNLDRFVAADDRQHVYYQDQIWDKILALAPRYTKKEVLDYIQIVIQNTRFYPKHLITPSLNFMKHKS